MDQELYFVGVDGGGTKTKCVISNSKGKILGEGFSGSSNPNFIGINEACKSVLLSLKIAANNMGKNLDGTRFGCICIGASGAGPKNRIIMNRIMLQYFKLQRILCQRLIVTSDALIAWYGAFNGNDGIVAISGTGTLVYGRVNNKVATSADIGDKLRLLRGGGFHIGLYAIKICFNHLNKGRKSILLDIIYDAFNDEKVWSRYHDALSFEELLKDGLRCFEGKMMRFLTRSDVASLSEYVNEAAGMGDNWAQMILNQSSRQLAENISTVANLLGVGGSEFQICIVGSVLKSIIVKVKIKNKLLTLEPYAIITNPLFSPEIGALNIALTSNKPIINQLLKSEAA